MLSVLLRPRRVASASFDPSHTLDQNLKKLALDLDLMERVHILPIPRGSALEERAVGMPGNHTMVRLETYGNGEIRAARALKTETPSFIDSFEDEERLEFAEIAHFLQRTILFALHAHKLEDRELEMEAYFELEGCSGCRVEIPVSTKPQPLGSAHAEIHGNPISLIIVGKSLVRRACYR